MGEFILNGRNYGGSIITPNPSDTPTDTLDSVKIGDTTYEIQGGGGGGSNLILDAQKYSFDEQVVGIWTDGKPLYQRTFEYSTGLNLNSSGVALPSVITSELTNVDKFIRAEGVRTTSGLTQAYIGMWVNSDRKVYTADPWSKVNIFTFWYTKSTDTAGSGGYQAYGFSPIIYSDVEREVGVWTDGKPLYQKTFLTTSPSNNTSTNIIEVTNLDIDVCIKCAGVIYNALNQTHEGGGSFVLWMRNNFQSSGKDYVACTVSNSSYYSNTMLVTIQYTKTTDTAGSGEYNTLATPNVHYSTDEQVIGTWIDGKPLYQKTCVTPLTLNTGSGEKTYTLDISDVDKFISVDYSIGTNTTAINITRTSSADEIRARITQGNQLIVWSGYDRSTLTIYTTMKYTKTTD